MTSPLLHLVTTAQWRAVLSAGAVEPAPGPFVHLSTPGQVALPASALFAGRDDVLLLVLDPARIGAEVRFEDGDPPHPDGLLFPHAYGPVPAAAVLAAVPYRPRPDGGFDAPGPLPTSVAARAGAVDVSIRQRAADEVVPVTGGVAMRTAAFPKRRSANLLVVSGPASADEIDADAERVLGGWGLGHRVAWLLGAEHAQAAAALAGRGWSVDAEVTMAARAAASHVPAGVGEVGAEALLPLWLATRQHRHADITADEIGQMLGSHAATGAVTDVRFIAVRVGGDPVAAAVLKIDGATALFGPLDTLPTARRRGHGDALLAAALDTAARAGCDLVALDALADDWPRHWYARRGFAEVGRTWSAHRGP